MENKRIANNVFVEDEKLLNAVTSKWPALVVAGTRVTEQQAAEILIRTDSHVPDFLYAGNDSHHAERLNRLFGIPPETYSNDSKEQQEMWDRLQNLTERLGKIPLGYLSNDQIVSAWIGGPHGWCNWSGDIFANTFNIGKWPSVEDVAADWGRLAKAFPFLDLRCQLYKGETGESDNKPVVEFVVSEGVVVVTSPRGIVAPPVTIPINPAILFGSSAREQGISVEELKAKLIMVYGEEFPQL